MARSANARAEDFRARSARLGLRIDVKTKRLVERAARLESRSVTDFCLTALTRAARLAIEAEQSIVLSEADRVAFFDVLEHPPKPSARLRRALRAERARVAR